MDDGSYTAITQGEADRLHAACRYRQSDWVPGSTEPWIIDIVAALLLGSGERNVLELGGYKGACSRVLAQTLHLIGGGNLLVVEYDPALAAGLRSLLPSTETVSVTILEMDALAALDLLPDQSVGFVWLDDSHDTPHVAEELNRLLPKMVENGLVCFHDVHGHFNLRTLVEALGGVALDLPRVSSSGGLGIVQVTPANRDTRFRIEEAGNPLAAGEVPLATLSCYGTLEGGLHYAARDLVG